MEYLIVGTPSQCNIYPGLSQGWETDPKFHFPIRGISTRPVALGTKRSRDGSLGGQVAVELNAVPVETVRAGC